MKARENIHST